jgi:hypothetical protein
MKAGNNLGPVSQALALQRGASSGELGNAARAFLLFIQIAERDGYEEAERVFARIVRISRERLRPKRSRRVREYKRRPADSRLFEAQLVGMWTVWKSQYPGETKKEFARWWATEWPHKHYKKIATGALLRRLNRALAKKAPA